MNQIWNLGHDVQVLSQAAISIIGYQLLPQNQSAQNELC